MIYVFAVLMLINLAVFAASIIGLAQGKHVDPFHKWADKQLGGKWRETGR
jgi:hypothetical protein